MHPDPQGRTKHPLAWCTGRRCFGKKQTRQLVLKEDGAQFGMLPQTGQSPSQQGCRLLTSSLPASLCALPSLLNPLSRVFSLFHPPTLQPKSRKTSSWNHPFFPGTRQTGFLPGWGNKLPVRQSFSESYLLKDLRFSNLRSEWSVSQ